MLLFYDNYSKFSISKTAKTINGTNEYFYFKLYYMKRFYYFIKIVLRANVILLINKKIFLLMDTEFLLYST